MDGNTLTLLTIVEPLWWLAFFAATGLCLGSFLNAVIYRLPRNISINNPRWSFCPSCGTRLRWYDNLPLVSYLRLKGRCRDCDAPISPRYPLGETLGAILAILVFDALVIAQTHSGLATGALGISWRLSQDWPIVLAHLILFACLFGMAAIDLENYWVDIRFTTVATVSGFVLHALWTPASSDTWLRPGPTAAAVTVAMTITVLLSLWVIRHLLPHDDYARDPDASAHAVARLAPRVVHAMQFDVSVAEIQETDHNAAPPPAQPRWLMMGVTTVAGAVLVGLIAGALAASRRPDPSVVPLRWLPALLLLFCLIVYELSRTREADTHIHDAIEEEAPSARRFAAIELVTLLPTAVVGAAVLIWMRQDADVHAAVAGWLRWHPVGDWRPLLGLSTAATGFIVGGAIGWLVRIPATLILGKEAFGTGDIHILAAAGCVAGWPVAMIGFILCSFLALAGWIIAIPLKRSRIIALVPWLAMGMLLVTLYFDPIINSQAVRNVTYVYDALVRHAPAGSVH